MLTETFTISGEVNIFPQKGGWHYVDAPEEYTEMTKEYADRGLVAITATVGDTSWDTSLLPKGDGTLFIALPAKVRKREKIELGNYIEVSFVLRER